MTFQWPLSLYPLRDFLKENGVEHDRHASARQAAFFAQQVIGSRIKFPPQGADMMPTLLAIQAALTKNAGAFGKAPASSSDLTKFGNVGMPKGAAKLVNKQYPPVDFSSGYHVFCDGACVPNPGPGGWGVVAYQDGREVASDHGGDAIATNNTMELTGLLKAIEQACQSNAGSVTIWCDSQYCVKGANEWRHGWKAKGWRRGTDKAKEKNQSLANVDLWKAIDEALGSPRAAQFNIKWLKGHQGTVGNERADELAEMGRLSLQEADQPGDVDLDAEYRRVMAG